MHYLGRTLPKFAVPMDSAAAKAYDWLPDPWKAFIAWRVQVLNFGLELLHLDRTICRLRPDSAAAQMCCYDRLCMLRAVWGGALPMVDTRLFTSDNWLVRKPVICALCDLVASWDHSDIYVPMSVLTNNKAAFAAAEHAVLKAYAQSYVDVLHRPPPFPIVCPEDPWAP